MYSSVIKIALSAVFAFSLVGCASQTELAVNEVDRHGVDAVIMENSVKVTYIKEHGHLDRFCASRESDSEKTSSQGFKLADALGEGIGEETTSGALSLGGRSPAVLITRELMYRACELSMNLNTDKKETVEVYRMFLDSIKKIAEVEHDMGSKSITALPAADNITVKEKTNTPSSTPSYIPSSTPSYTPPYAQPY